jgi:hypothetical protein
VPLRTERTSTPRVDSIAAPRVGRVPASAKLVVDALKLAGGVVFTTFAVMGITAKAHTQTPNPMIPIKLLNTFLSSIFLLVR